MSPHSLWGVFIAVHWSLLMVLVELSPGLLAAGVSVRRTHWATILCSLLVNEPWICMSERQKPLPMQDFIMHNTAGLRLSGVRAHAHAQTYTHTLTPHTHTHTIVSCVKHNPHTDELVNKCPHPHIPFHIHTIKPAVPEPNKMHNAFSSSPSSPFFSLSLPRSLFNPLLMCIHISAPSVSTPILFSLSVTHHGAPLPMETDVGSFSDCLELHFLPLLSSISLWWR